MGLARSAAVGVAALALGMGAAVALTSSSESAATDDVSIFCSEFVPHVEASNLYAKWASQNHGERDQWQIFRSAICSGGSPISPLLVSSFGQALVDAGEMALAIDVPPPTSTTTTTQPSTTTTTTTTTAPPPTGTAIDRFSGLKNANFGPDSAYPGSGAIFNRKCFVPTGS